ncbi:hypothetical protein ESZ50_02065 [Weissella muntiaci]|uniref:Uncharacterized protein n=1 Tax=Weissella muntiaci TaxID=2508881 RepID=A0A6C2C9P6_9LACO|nr:hypothetical protein [Weissella muntiaci]TYC50617.1 hypothetical protein ESZ50_02065 [Weissella muntiaci]
MSKVNDQKFKGTVLHDYGSFAPNTGLTSDGRNYEVQFSDVNGVMTQLQLEVAETTEKFDELVKNGQTFSFADEDWLYKKSF